MSDTRTTTWSYSAVGADEISSRLSRGLSPATPFVTGFMAKPEICLLLLKHLDLSSFDNCAKIRITCKFLAGLSNAWQKKMEMTKWSDDAAGLLEKSCLLKLNSI